MYSSFVPITLYNTLTKREEEFVPANGNTVTMYTCGPTVYGRPHIGNYASFLMADLLRRVLGLRGYDVKHVKNITDVGHLVLDRDDGEDKVEAQARKEKIDPLTIAKKYEEMYLQDERDLGFLEPFARPRATETIHEMLALIQKLLKSKHAYETSDGIYFSVESFPSYGKLSGNTLDQLDAGSRIAVKEEKKHPADFALWKKCVGANALHVLRWNFKTGKRVTTEGDDATAGFPGWHIECSAMSTKFLGETIDIHTGGEDNIFPHHECEIAQSESVSGKSFVKLWLHRRRIQMGEEKMSKSLGNVMSLPDVVAAGFSPMDLRYLLLSVHYRTNLKFSLHALEDAAKARARVMEWMKEYNDVPFFSQAEAEFVALQEMVALVSADTPQWAEQFLQALEDDLNTPAALAVLFDVITKSRSKEFSDEKSQRVVRPFMSIVRRAFGCFDAEALLEVPSEVAALVEQRRIAREAKNFAEADRLRAEILAEGFVIRDTEAGERVERA